MTRLWCCNNQLQNAERKKRGNRMGYKTERRNAMRKLAKQQANCRVSSTAGDALHTNGITSPFHREKTTRFGDGSKGENIYQNDSAHILQR